MTKGGPEEEKNRNLKIYIFFHEEARIAETLNLLKKTGNGQSKELSQERGKLSYEMCVKRSTSFLGKTNALRNISET